MNTYSLKTVSLLALLIIGFIYAYLPTAARLHEIWLNESAYSHGYLILAVCIYLLYEQWPDLRANKISYYRPALMGLLLTVLAWCFFYVIDNRTLQMLMLPAIIFHLVALLLGLPILRKSFFIITYLLFAIPIWQLLVPYLQQLAIYTVSFLLALTNLPATVSGEIITLPSGRFAIAEGCSGLRYLLVAMALSALYGYLNLTTLKARSALLVMSIIVSLIANWLRIFSLVLIGYYSEMNSRLVDDHEDFGWVIFALSFIPIVFFIRFLHRSESNPVKLDSPAQLTSYAGPASFSLYIAAFCLAVMLPIGLQSTMNFWYSQANQHSLQLRQQLPNLRSVWQGPKPYSEIASLDWRPAFFLANETQSISYEANSINATIHLHVYYYARANHEINVFNRQNELVDGANWQISTQSKRVVNGMPLTELLIINASGQKKIVWWWYDMAGYITHSQLKAKLTLVKTGYQQKGHAFIAINRACLTSDCQRARDSLVSFIDNTQEQFQQLLKN